MPTDDDYGRRERLLLHQHPTAQYGPPSVSPVPGTNSGTCRSSGIQAGSSNSSDCYYKHSESRCSSSASAPNQDRYQDQRSQTNDHSEYGSRDRFDKSKEDIGDNISKSSESRSSQSNCEYSISQNQDRFQTSSSLHSHAYSGRPSCQTISQNLLADRYSRYGESPSVHNQQQQQQVSGSVSERYGRSDSGLVSSGTGNEYANSSVLATASGNPFSPDTFPSPPSPAPANDRFVPPPPLSPCPSDKYSSSQSLAGYPPADR